MSLLDKIKNEYQSPTVKVPERIDKLIPSAEESLVENQTKSPKETGVASIDIASLEKELETLPSVVSSKIGVRLSSDIYSDVRQFCSEHNITVETLLEAYFMICRNHPELLSQIIEDAQARIKLRTKAGNIRSLLTKAKNLNNK